MISEVESPIRVLTYNIQDGAEDYFDTIIRIVRESQASIVALQEVLDDSLFQELAEATGLTGIIGRGNHGYDVGLLTKYPIIEWKNLGSSFHLYHTALHAKLQTPFGVLDVCNLHLYPGYNWAMRCTA